MAALVYYSLTGQTQAFVNKLQPEATRLAIDPIDPHMPMDQAFILVMPTYEREILEPVDSFLETGNNIQWCQGIFAGGNRNFAQLFCYTAKDISVDYGIPLLHCFEFQGSATDLDILNKELKQIDQTTDAETTSR